LLEFSAGISEAGAAALPAAVLLSCYRRDDLPEGSVGFIGLLHSDWRPTSSSSEFLLVFGVEGRLHIKRHNPLRFLLGSELLEHLDAIGSRWTAGCRVDALHRALKSGLSWLPIPAEKLGFPLNLSVDRLIVVPSYGCFVEGWILSPVKRVASLRLRLGSQVTRCDPRSLYWKPRPDLADAFPASGPLLERAGFVGVFPGGELPEECAQPVLNIRFEDGASLNHSIPFDALAGLGNAADLSEIGRLYPAMHQEPFFSGWAMAVRREARLLNRGCVPFAVEPTEAALVFTVPADRCDAFLLFEELRQRMGQDLIPPGVVFIANRNSCRAETVALFGAMARDADWPCSLFFMDDTRYALHALPEVFSQTRMQRFVFIADSVLLTKSGWRDALEALSTPEPQLTFLEVERIGTFDSDFTEGPSTECFVWSTSAFIWWEKNAPGFFGGYYRDNGLGLDAPNPKRCPNAAVRAKQVAHDAIADAINAVGFA
jgi:hypothetical protein